MKYLTIVALAVVAGCSGSSPTAPTPPPVIVTPATIITLRGLVRSLIDGRSVSGAAVSVAFSGQTTTTAGDGTYALQFSPRTGVPTTTIQIGGAALAVIKSQDVANIDNTFTVHDVIPTGSGFDLAFYRMFALDAYDGHGATYPLYRQSQPPRIYLKNVHDVTGQPIDRLTLDQTAAALINTTGGLTGTFGLAGLEQGPGTRINQPGWITVWFTNDPERRYCGRGSAAGNWIELYTNTPGCRCAGGPTVRLRTVKHELGHALGFYHTDSENDLMYGTSVSCDANPSAREVLHAKIAYSQPIGSRDP